MEVFGLGDFFSDNLRELFWTQEALIRRVATPTELGLLLTSIETIESQIHEAQKWTRPGGGVDRKLARLKKKNLFSDAFFQILEEDLVYNRKDLSELLDEIACRMREIGKIRKRFDTKYDDTHLGMVIEYSDINSLQKIYDFLDHLGPGHLKLFAWVYNGKRELMDGLIGGTSEDVTLPDEIREKIIRKVRDAYFKSENRYLDPTLRLEILDRVEPVLEADCQLLRLTLNFVRVGKAKEKIAYRIPLAILEESKNWGLTDVRKRMARRYWTAVRNSLNDYEPEAFHKNYEINLKDFLKDKENIVGDAL
jgi:hypothetical protein